MGSAQMWILFWESTVLYVGNVFVTVSLFLILDVDFRFLLRFCRFLILAKILALS